MLRQVDVTWTPNEMLDRKVKQVKVMALSPVGARVQCKAVGVRANDWKREQGGGIIRPLQEKKFRLLRLYGGRESG